MTIREIVIAGSRLPQRWIFAIMGFLAILNAYTMRICLSITITEMAVPLKHNYTDDTCLNEKDISNKTKNVMDADRYHWDEYTQVKNILYEMILH